jgi:hypothetical protein
MLWALASILVKLTLRHFVLAGNSSFLEAATPLLNTAVFASCGIIFFAEVRDDKRGGAQGGLTLLILLILLHVGVFLSTYIGDYYEWTHRIAASEHVDWAAAAHLRDESLQRRGHSAGLSGYFALVATTPARAIDPDDVPDDLPEIIVWAIPKFLQWLARLAALRIEGLIELLYWYVIAVVLTVSTGSWYHGRGS